MKAAIEFSESKGVTIKLSELAKAVAKKILRRAMLAGTKAPYKQMKANAKSVADTGLLAKSIGRKVKVYRGSGVVVGVIGPQAGFRRIVERPKKGSRRAKFIKETLGIKYGKGTGRIIMDPNNYAHLVELGSRRSRAHPFMRPAWDTAKAESEAAIAATLKEGIEEAVR